ncbi:MAG: hypothetical protein EPN98_04675 [Phenylobacterium sp.]|nr:MAG: hypothetical protein EPN98_04675 [Phenylobacterium sp.]
MSKASAGSRPARRPASCRRRGPSRRRACRTPCRHCRSRRADRRTWAPRRGPAPGRRQAGTRMRRTPRMRGVSEEPSSCVLLMSPPGN